MFQKILKSRTIWTLVFMLAFNVFAAIQSELPAQIVLIANAIFSTVATYFKINPSQQYNG